MFTFYREISEQEVEDLQSYTVFKFIFPSAEHSNKINLLQQEKNKNSEEKEVMVVFHST